jgi:preprotein translocase subunit SecE
MQKESKTWISKIIDFFRQTALELKRVSWPTKKETFQYTVIVILITIIVAVYLWGLDIIFSYFIKKFFF